MTFLYLTNYKTLTCKLLNLLIYLSITIDCFSQNSKPSFIADSLKNYSYEQLYTKQNQTYDTLKIKIYSQAYLQKAKKENDTLRIAHAYSQHASISNSNTQLKYADSIFELTKNWSHYLYPSYVYLVRGAAYYQLGNYEESLTNYLKTYTLSTKFKNDLFEFYALEGIATIKYQIGNYKDAIQEHKKLLKFITKDEKKNKGRNQSSDNDNYLLTAYYGLATSYLKVNQLDSALLYSKKGIDIFLTKEDSAYDYYGFVGLSGAIYFHKNEVERALDSLNKALPSTSTLDGKIFQNQYRGKIYAAQNNISKAFYHFKKADSLHDLNNDYTVEIVEIQTYLVNYYKSNNDLKNQLKYTNRLLYTDSIIDSYRKNIGAKINMEYDRPLLISSKQKIINEITLRESKAKNVNVILIVFIICILVALLLNSKSLLIKNKKHLLNRANKSQSAKSIIPSKTLNDILVKLEEFENNNAFINPKITLHTLSKEFNTNSSYLSKIVNQYKNKNFSTYLSDLRIEYSTKRIINDRKFKKYTIKAIAFDSGFNNVQSFSNLFYQKNGLYPSEFIKNIS